MTPAQRFPDTAARGRGWAIAGLVVMALGLAGCTPGAPPEPSESAAPSAEPTPGETPSASPTATALVLPDSCEGAVPLTWIKANFGDGVERIMLDPNGGGPVTGDFNATGAMVCFWGIPNSGAGFSMTIAERATATDDEQVAAWEAAGYQLGPDFLDALWYESGPAGGEEFVRLYALVEGWEIQTDGYGTELDPYLLLIRQATDSMGYL